MRVNFEPGVLKIASSNAEQEEAKEELEIDYGGDTIEIGFNVTYLIDVLANADQDMVTISLLDANSSALFHRARAARLQVRRDAHAHLSAAISLAPDTAPDSGPGPHAPVRFNVLKGGASCPLDLESAPHE